ncbi:2,3-diaminopropionate biosynthesis protein SbnA [Nocardiopsis terrae]|uniref:N-(2-amino-2-carboxyethyl)-L-glutamate synthase n=1 Tax=Nocardiopsis terrae TaxID=372655 RepID=A0ABR9HAA6_9ACTN|nr:2,3-diaminopropionate biosynthesis protein SbnA [Nocardiopsis terrae]MBE1455947.1 cysteine synthase A [Nocardiopsis terrae]GHC96560.1 2,3-diaminopropionate biosynthesis protein SbnA [Nocardiopsis terrae]
MGVVENPNTGILSAVGGTPLVSLVHLFSNAPFRVLAKVEGMNPGGSIKDRAALNMLVGKLRDGTLMPGRSVVVESSSGNLAIGMAQICRWYGVRFICVVDAKTTSQNIAVLRAYGTEVDIVTEKAPATGDYLAARIARVRHITNSTAHAYWPNQYANPLNAEAHRTTMREILEQAGGRVDHLYVATSSCGTISGCVDYLREHSPRTRVTAVDAEGSAIFGCPPGRRLIPGHGAAVVPGLYRQGLADTVVHVSDLDCVVGCRRLIGSEAILAGGSSGAIITALERTAPSIGAGETCVVVLPDRGERYVDTIYDDGWVRAQFGDVEHLWKAAAS